MADLLLKPFGTRGEVHRVTPALAGWRYVGFALHRLRPGDTACGLTGTDEVSMMLATPRLKVVHVTTHVGLVDAIRRIEPGLVHPVEKGLELCFGLAGVAHDEG